MRLHPGDAKFVDVLHTDGRPLLGLGMSVSTGHVDFYFNGIGRQPRCSFFEHLTDIRSLLNLRNVTMNRELIFQLSSLLKRIIYCPYKDNIMTIYSFLKKKILPIRASYMKNNMYMVIILSIYWQFIINILYGKYIVNIFLLEINCYLCSIQIANIETFWCLLQWFLI